jgi:phosphate uptake regulator
MLAARSVERIGDHAEKIATNVVLAVENKTKLGKTTDISELSARSLSSLDRAMDAFFKKDIRSANVLIDDAQVLAQDCQNRMNDLRAPGNAAAVSLASVLDSIARTTMYAMDIAEVAINAAMREDSITR